MKIQELKPSKRVKGRYLVTLDEGTLLRVGEQEILDFGLHIGLELSIEQAQALEQAGNLTMLKNKAFQALSRRPLSRHDLEEKLRYWEATQEEVDTICTRMEDLALLDDVAYSKTLVRHYHRKGYGTKKLEQQLYQHGISREYWEDALAERETMEEEENPLDRFLQQKLKGTQPSPKELKRVTDALARRGFSWNEIREAVLRYDQSYSENWEME